MEEKLPENYKKSRKKAIFIRVVLVLLSWVIFYYAYFHMPIPSNLKRAFGEEDCIAKGGKWVEHKSRCMQGINKPKQ